MNYLLCCDWGTSSFRLRLISPGDQKLVGELTNGTGISATFDAWKKSGVKARDLFFCQQLKYQIDQLASQLPFPLSQVPVVISGMASSSIGMAEVPYATLPFAIDGSQASTFHLAQQEDFPHELILISGVRSQSDVMRGEETQLIGLASLLAQSGKLPQEAIFIFPGTHSKHMYVQNGQLTSFETYMTGEVFNLMATHSILKDSVDTKRLTEVSDSDWEAFIQGVQQSDSVLLNQLFKVRTNQLFGRFDKQENTYYLSGLLIGAELNPLRNRENWQLVVCSSNSLYAFYKRAIETLRLSDRTTFISAELVDKATVMGQVTLFRNQPLKTQEPTQ